MIEAFVRPEQGSPYGMFRFVELPRPGDRIAVSSGGGGGSVLAVLYVLHNPAPTGSDAFAPREPVATVIVHHLEDFDGTLRA